MHNDKSAGPDGSNVDFFKACWNIVKQEILQVVEDSKRHRTILKALNSSFIALIPKQELAQTPNRFRPIALCIVVYKSKVVANRLKPLLPTLVSGEQFDMWKEVKFLITSSKLIKWCTLLLVRKKLK